jgi:hypothetical protein
VFGAALVLYWDWTYTLIACRCYRCVVGTGLALDWYCTGITLVLHWYWAGSVLVLYWYCTGTVLVLYWLCFAMLVLNWHWASYCTCAVLVFYWYCTCTASCLPQLLHRYCSYWHLRWGGKLCLSLHNFLNRINQPAHIYIYIYIYVYIYIYIYMANCKN